MVREKERCQGEQGVTLNSCYLSARRAQGPVLRAFSFHGPDKPVVGSIVTPRFTGEQTETGIQSFI